MTEHQQSFEDLQHIKKMMERSSRFISLSGLRGVSAGLCTLIGVWLAKPYVMDEKDILINNELGLAQANSYTIVL